MRDMQVLSSFSCISETRIEFRLNLVLGFALNFA
jgi:hypothetical protein